MQRLMLFAVDDVINPVNGGGQFSNGVARAVKW